MIEILPNWHPIFVHFTIGLYTAAAGFYTLAYLTSQVSCMKRIYSSEFEVVARWSLWIAALITAITVLAGWQAYNSVNHDGPSHLAMTNHRNWALPTASAIILVALWAAWRHYKQRSVTLVFTITVLLVQCLLLSTAWRGAELVYRYGLGVLSMPKSEGEGHQHQHNEGINGSTMDHSTMPPMNNDEHSTPHDHAD